MIGFPMPDYGLMRILDINTASKPMHGGLNPYLDRQYSLFIHFNKRNHSSYITFRCLSVFLYLFRSLCVFICVFVPYWKRHDIFELFCHLKGAFSQVIEPKIVVFCLKMAYFGVFLVILGLAKVILFVLSPCVFMYLFRGLCVFLSPWVNFMKN